MNQNSQHPTYPLTTPPDQFNRVNVFGGLTKQEWLAAQLFIAEYSRELYNRELEHIIIMECYKTANNFFNIEEKI